MIDLGRLLPGHQKDSDPSGGEIRASERDIDIGPVGCAASAGNPPRQIRAGTADPLQPDQNAGLGVVAEIFSDILGDACARDRHLSPHNLDGAPEAKRSDVPFIGSMGMGGAPLREEGESEAPIAQASLEEPMASNARMGKWLSPKAQPSALGDHHVKDPSPAPKGRPVLRLIISNRGEPTHAAHEGVLTPTRRVGSPLVLVWSRHASTGIARR